MLAIARIGKTLLFGVLLSTLLSPGVWAAQGAGTIKVLTGSATITRDSAKVAAEVGQRVFSGDRISTAADSHISIVLRDDTRLTLGPGGECVIRQFEFDASSYAGELLISFIKGTSRVVTGIIGKHTPDRVRFEAATATIGIRGTDFIVDMGDPK